MLRKLKGVLTRRNVMLLMYWPVFGLCFKILEEIIPHNGIYVMHSAIDDMIPFCEWFAILYVAWYAYEAGVGIYTIFNEQKSFEKFMSFVIIGYSISLIIYMLFPNCQNMRPTEFESQNIGTFIMSRIYAADTNTNVCPSIHVVGSFATAFAFASTRLAKRRKWMNVINWMLCIAISASTVFVKQHSIVDVAFGLALSYFTYILVYVFLFGRTNQRKQLRTSKLNRKYIQ